MGGSAFTLSTHGFTTSRMTQTQYSALSKSILPLLQLYFRTVLIPPEAPGKLSYGDLDIMVRKPLDLHPHDAILQFCSHALGDRCKAFIYNLPTTNIAVVCEDIVVQLDVHVLEQDEVWEIDYWMHSWGDMGMIVSSLIKAWGLRLSASRGLWVEIPGRPVFGLSFCMEQIARFLGLDWQRYQWGFASVEDLFEWIEGIVINGEKVGVKSKGKLEMKMHNDRPMWVAFWSRGENVAYAPSDEEKRKVFEQALDYFGKRKEFDDIMAQLAKERCAKAKFNGKKVMEWTGAYGKNLGELMKALKQDERVKNVDNLIATEDEDIKAVVLEYHNRMSCQRTVV